jgi:hypothetical protein
LDVLAGEQQGQETGLDRCGRASLDYGSVGKHLGAGRMRPESSAFHRQRPSRRTLPGSKSGQSLMKGAVTVLVEIEREHERPD